MKNLMEKAERMMATILEIMQEEPEHSETTSSVADDEPVAENNLSSDAHHNLVELCW